MSNEQEMREAFEKVHCNNNRHITRRNEHGDYVLPSIQDAYSGWKSATLAAEARIRDLEDAVLIGTAMLNEIISADEQALGELADIGHPVPEPALTAKARHTVAEMTKALGVPAALTECKENQDGN